MNTTRVLRILSEQDPIQLLANGLRQSYLDSPERKQQDPFEKRRAQRKFEPIIELPELTSEEIESWKQIEANPFEHVESIEIDLLAWYQPYSDYGPSAWGIYFDEQKMNSYARSIFAAIKRVRSRISPQTVHRLVWDEVMRHEREHCVQELTAAALSTFFTPIDKSSLEIYSQKADDFEALATHFQHTDTAYRSQRGAPGEFNFAKTLTAATTKPAGYKEWNRIDVPRTDASIYEGNKFADVHKIANQFRRQIKKPVSNPYLVIPVYKV